MNDTSLNYTIRTILVPTDFSDLAKNALKYAVTLATRLNAKMLILYVYNIPIIPGRTPHVLYPQDIQENIKLAEQQLKSLEAEVPKLCTIAYETKTTPGYGPAEIPEIIRNQNVDLIVMGTKGASGIKEVILGSNAASVIENAVCPVLAVPEEAQYKEIKNIGFAYDKKPNIPKLKILATFAKLFNAEIQVFHVKEKSEDIEVEEVASRDLLNSYFRDINYSYMSFYNENIEEGINRYIHLKSIDIITMIPKKHNLFHRLFKSSLTKKMAFHALTPLLTIPENNSTKS